MESAVTMAVSPTSMSGTLRSRAWGGGAELVSSAARPPHPPHPAPPCPHLDDVTVAQGERQLRLLLHPRAVLQRGLQLDRDYLALGRAAGARWAWDQRLLPQQPVPCQGEGADSLSQSGPDGWLPLRQVAEHQGTAEFSVTPLPLPGQVTPRLWAPVSPSWTLGMKVLIWGLTIVAPGWAQ